MKKAYKKDGDVSLLGKTVDNQDQRISYLNYLATAGR
jgi:hypothetical protein